MSLYHCDSLTVQWCIISESLYLSNHIKGTHGFGGIWGGNFCTYHHNLFAHHSSRNPRFASGSQYTDFRNNVIYNWGYNSVYGGEAVQPGNENKFAFTNINIVANYYKPGPATKPGRVSHRIVNPTGANTEHGFGKWYVSENYMYGNTSVTKDNWDGGVHPQNGNAFLETIRLETEYEGTMKIKQETAEEAFLSVLDHAGATLPKRDQVDNRIVGETRNGTATFEGKAYRKNQKPYNPSKICGIIDSQNDVGGWPKYGSKKAPADSDHDGMPDKWEDAHSLDKHNPSDRNMLAPDGYTMLERYLNNL
jgi:pectate lyase